MASTSSIDVRLRLRGARTFQRDVARSGAELEALGVRGAGAMTAFAQKADKLKSFGRRMTTAVTLPIAGMGIVAGKVAMDFDKSMRNVNSIAQLPERQFDRLSERVTNLAGPTAQAPTTLAEGLYDLVSSGFDADESMKILKSSAFAATAGLTDTATSTKAVAAVLNAYHLPADKAKLVSDQLFRTVDRGVVSFEELASNIGDVLPFASSLGVGLDQVGASIATMTKAGISPAETMTRIKAVMTTLLKPGTDLSTTLKDLGYESGEAMIKALGFQGTLDKLAQTTGGSKEEMAKLFPNVRALGGALALTGKNSKGAAKDLSGMQKSGGATAKALAEQSKSMAFQWNKLKAEAQALAIQMGPPLLSAFRGIVSIVSKVVGWFSKLSPQTQGLVVKFILLLGAIGPVSSVLGYFAGGVGRLVIFLPKLINFVKGFLALRAGVGMLGALKVALAGFGITLKGVMLTTGIGAVIAAIILLNEKFHFLGPTLEWIKRAAANTWEWIKGAIRTIAPVATKVWNVIKKAALTAWKLIRLYFTPLELALKAGFAVIKKAAAIAWDFIQTKAKPVFEWLVDKAKSVIDRVKSIASGIAGVFKSIFEKIKAPIVSIINFVIDRINNLIDAHNALPFVGDIGHIGSIEDPISMPSRRNGIDGATDWATGGGPDRGGGRRGRGRPRLDPLPRESLTATDGNGRPIHHTTIFKLEGREIARGTVKNLEREAARA